MDKYERKIISGIKSGDRTVFRELFDTYYTKLFLYAKSYVDNEKEAEDIVQDLFFHLWEKRKDVVIFSSVSAYFFRAIHNRCIQFLRHKKVVEGYEARHLFKIREAETLYKSSNDFSFSTFQIKEIQLILDKVYDDLPEKTRQVFCLSREGSKSNKDIAKAMDMSIKNVEYYITKALRKFRFALRDYLV
jgi:RNA polymerase sigma-70 factor (ECF subfamily)